jgi:hypothetical protein
MSDVTFRDFAGAMMQNDSERAADVLGELLGLDGPGARTAADHFQQQMSEHGQAFMMKAMGLRAAVTGGDDSQLHALLGECFGLSGEAAATAVNVLRARYPGQ